EGLGGGGVATLEGRDPARHRAFRRHGVSPQGCGRAGRARLHITPTPSAALFFSPRMAPFRPNGGWTSLFAGGVPRLGRLARSATRRRAGRAWANPHPRSPVTEWIMSEKNPDPLRSQPLSPDLGPATTCAGEAPGL